MKRLRKRKRKKGNDPIRECLALQTEMNNSVFCFINLASSFRRWSLTGLTFLFLFLWFISLWGTEIKPPKTPPGESVKPFNIGKVILEVNGEFWEDRMPMVLTEKRNVQRFHSVWKILVKNGEAKNLEEFVASAAVLYYEGTKKEFCRLKLSPLGDTMRVSIKAGERRIIEFAGTPEQSGEVKEKMKLYGRVLLKWKGMKEIVVTSPLKEVMITY